MIGVSVILIVVVMVVALVATLIIIRQEENKLKKYEEEGDTPANELKRSIEYETKSMSSVKNIGWIYGVFIAVTIIGFLLYLNLFL